MDTKKYFLLRTFTDAGTYSTNTVTQYIDETSARARLWSDYSISSDGPLTAEIANRAGTWCIAAERLCRATRFTQRRAVIVELRENEAFDCDKPTWTLCQDFGVHPQSGARVAPTPLAGKRLANINIVDQGYLSSHVSAYIARGRARGPRWQLFLWGAVCNDDIVPITQQEAANNFETYPVGLDKTGALFGYCWPWAQWCYQQAPEVTNAVDVKENGEWALPSDGPTTSYTLKEISVRSKLWRWMLRRPPERNRLDNLFLDADTLIQDACRQMQFGDVGKAFDGSTYYSDYDYAETRLLLLALLFRDFADLCDFQIPQPFEQWLGITVMGFARWNDTQYENFAGFGRLAEAQNRYHDRYYSAPAASVKRLTVTRNRAQILKCVNRLFAAFKWWRENRITTTNSGYGDVKSFGWSKDSDGTLAKDVSAPSRGRYASGYFYTSTRPFSGASQVFYDDATAAAAGFPYRDAPNYIYDFSSLEARQQAVIWHNRWDEWQDWAFGIIDAINWLELLLYPENTRRRLTNKEMKMPLPHSVEGGNRDDTSPASIEFVPQLVCHRKARPPWLNRPQAPPPPSNSGTLQTAPPKALTAAQVKRNGDERRAYALFNEQRRAIQNMSRDWELDYPSRGLVPYRSARTGEVKYINDSSGGNPTIPEQPGGVGLPT